MLRIDFTSNCNDVVRDLFEKTIFKSESQSIDYLYIDLKYPISTFFISLMPLHQISISYSFLFI